MILENVQINNSGSSGLYVWSGVHNNLNFNNLELYNSSSFGVYINSETNNLTINNSISSFTSAEGFIMGRCNNCVFVNVESYNNLGYGFRDSSNSSYENIISKFNGNGISFLEYGENIIKNSNFSENIGNGVYIIGSSVSNNSFDNVYVKNTSNYGIYLYGNISNSTFKNSVIKYNSNDNLIFNGDNVTYNNFLRNDLGNSSKISVVGADWENYVGNIFNENIYSDFNGSNLICFSGINTICDLSPQLTITFVPSSSVVVVSLSNFGIGSVLVVLVGLLFVLI